MIIKRCRVLALCLFFSIHYIKVTFCYKPFIFWLGKSILDMKTYVVMEIRLWLLEYVMMKRMCEN